MSSPKRFFTFIYRLGLITQIAIMLILGIALAYYSPQHAQATHILGDLFVSALKAVAPILVLILVSASIANHKKGEKSNMKPIIVLYALGTFFAALIAVFASFLFPSTITLSTEEVSINPPQGVFEVFESILFKMVDNPFSAVINANYISLIVWGIGLGLALRHSSETTKLVVKDLSASITYVVRIVVHFAPIGIFGLVSSTLANTGFDELWNYAHLIAVLLGCMFIVLLVLNPLLVFWKIKANPFPLVFLSLRTSAVTAFFTRSSAANIPVNMELCKNLRLPESTYSVAIPLGATINMAGAAITITVLTLAAVHTLGIAVDFPTALLLSFIAAVCACGASGVAGGSLLLIPVACSMFGIPNDIAMMVVGVGFIIGVIQDSAETAVNSSTDVVFTAAACEEQALKEGHSILFPHKNKRKK